MLVTIFLRGGADTLNLLVPHGDDAYHRARPTLAIAAPHRLDAFWGLHPALGPLVPFWDNGTLAFVHGVGCDDTSGSHFVAQAQVEHGAAMGETLGGGWLGRWLRARGLDGPLPAIAVGERVQTALAGAPRVAAMRRLDDLVLGAGANPDALARWYATDPLFAAPAKAAFELLARVERVRAVPSTGDYPEGRFGDALREVARLGRAGVGLEVACVDYDAWDTHFVQAPLLEVAATALAKGIAALVDELGRARVDLTVLVLTEFGRRTWENGSAGTDHGRGYAAMLLGPRVRGGLVHGKYVGLGEVEGPGPGGLAITVDYRDVLGEALRAAANPSVTELAAAFPTRPLRELGVARL
jgi:uncharacterized protein (DUF1501 family)